MAISQWAAILEWSSNKLDVGVNRSCEQPSSSLQKSIAINQEESLNL
jgi:hypothetical protein